MDCISQLDSDKKFPFECISKRISFLLMFQEIIDKHVDELEDSYKKVFKDIDAKPSQQLMEYIILEIRSFYWVAYRAFKDEIKYPDYIMSTLKSFRDNIIAHFTSNNPRELVEFYRQINDIGFDKILSDYMLFRDEVFKMISDINKS